jgi:hypothetical protein
LPPGKNEASTSGTLARHRLGVGVGGLKQRADTRRRLVAVDSTAAEAEHLRRRTVLKARRARLDKNEANRGGVGELAHTLAPLYVASARDDVTFRVGPRDAQLVVVRGAEQRGAVRTNIAQRIGRRETKATQFPIELHLDNAVRCHDNSGSSRRDAFRRDDKHGFCRKVCWQRVRRRYDAAVDEKSRVRARVERGGEFGARANDARVDCDGAN